MRTICAWCSKHISGPLEAPANQTSHGICENCLIVEFGITAEELNREAQA